jgi:hypothetical protein
MPTTLYLRATTTESASTRGSCTVGGCVRACVRAAKLEIRENIQGLKRLVNGAQTPPQQQAAEQQVSSSRQAAGRSRQAAAGSNTRQAASGSNRQQQQQASSRQSAAGKQQQAAGSPQSTCLHVLHCSRGNPVAVSRLCDHRLPMDLTVPQANGVRAYLRRFRV